MLDTLDRQDVKLLGSKKTIGSVQDRHHLLCFHYILNGLRHGLCKFSGPSRVAVIYALRHEDPLHILDPQGLLQGHKAHLNTYFKTPIQDLTRSPEVDTESQEQTTFSTPDIPGLLCLSRPSRGAAYQMWFTERHADFCSPGPTLRWMEFALLQLSQSLIIQDILALESAGHLLQEMAVHAIHDHIANEYAHLTGSSPHLDIHNLLESIIQISKTPEEGAWARGHLGFVDPTHISRVNFLARFPEAEQPYLGNYKHVRKLLQAVERSPRTLISDGHFIIGIAVGDMPPDSLSCEFRGRHGIITLNRVPVCSFADGAFQGTNRQPKLITLESSLQVWPLTPKQRSRLFNCVSRIVTAAGEGKYGCTIIVDPNDPPLHFSGQPLDGPVDLDRDENLRLAAALSKVDGALHIDGAAHLRAFACIMDGPALPTEDRARGARYNSALRFTATHPGLLVVVVSFDRPVSVIQNGLDLSQPPSWLPIPDALSMPPTLESWLKA